MPNTRGPVRVAIVNDYELVVAGVAALLQPFSDRVEVVELDSQVPVLSDVDVVLYDSFGQVQGDQIDVEEILGRSGAKLAVFSWNVQPDLVQRSLENGASAYLSKAVGAEQLVELLERVRDGEVVTPDETSPEEAGSFGRWPGEELGLSQRESEVLALITQGMSNDEIGKHAYIGINTVKTYIRTLYRKIGVTRRSQAVAFGIDHGFRPDQVRHADGRTQRER
ncbi:response regulator transcription factor [Nocardioides marmotae]|uniref:response regulator transcription factor n=1 Tax=Nocardioides marmotae TaxID=2663857 RepID=UPI0012B51C6E|nr:response regulator transcription factor [Nocardioides marmotae]MBC9734778.1 response regulator transcription factor [Nocardioides marmotae]MTB85879.1 DNA-binding response regulator [Nocardioides marmotae]